MAESLTPSMESESSISGEKQEGVQQTLLKTGDGKLSFRCAVASARLAAKAGAFDVHDVIAYALPLCPATARRLLHSIVGSATSEIDNAGSPPEETQSAVNREPPGRTSLTPPPNATARILDREASAESLLILAILLLALIERRLLLSTPTSEQADTCCYLCQRGQQPSDGSRAQSAAGSAQGAQDSAEHDTPEEEQRPFRDGSHDRQPILPSGACSVNARARDGYCTDFPRNNLRCFAEDGRSLRVTWSPDRLALMVSRVYYYSGNYMEEVFSPSSATCGHIVTLSARCGIRCGRVVLLFNAQISSGLWTDMERFRSQGRLEFVIHHPTCPARSRVYIVPASQPKRETVTDGIVKLRYRLTESPIPAAVLQNEGLWHMGTLMLSVKVCAQY